MSFFESLNDKFFNPFCCRNRAVYFDCISQLIEKSKEIPVLYETDARNTLILYLQNCAYSLETENIGEEIGNGRTPQENASAILRYFRACGWITPQEIGRSGDNIASVSAYCRKLLDASHSIREIMRAVMRMADANSFGQYLIKDELLSRFFNDYFFIKKSGLIPSYISDIDRMLRKLRRSELYDRMIQEYIRVANVSEAQAREKVERQFGELDSFINLEYDQEMNYIDRKINTYYNLYSTRMMMVLSGNTNLEHQLNRLLLFLKDMDEEDRGEAIGRLSQAHRLQSIGYVGRKSFERRRKRNPNPKNAGLLADDLTQEEKQRLTDELLTETPDRYSMDHVEKYFTSLLAGREKITVEECGVHTRDDATMSAASIIYSGTAGFPYEVEFGEGMVETEAARISRVTIKRKDRTE